MTTATTEQIGKYTLVRHIATGGMAENWLAHQQGPGGFAKELVIKRILPHLARDEVFTQMFLDEARLVAQLSHPNIGQIYDLGEADGSFFLAMEYIEGLDLASVLQLAPEQGKGLSVPLCVRLMVPVLQALEFAHNFEDRHGNAVGIVHRDVTPHNVLVSKDGIVKLVDFGVAKAAENKNKTETGAVKGKYAYMAPEQVQSLNVDRRVDVFAAGVLLYELLTLVKPFGEDLYAIASILNEDPADPRGYRPDIPEPLVRIITRALHKNPDMRFGSADEMLRALEGYLRSVPEPPTTRDVRVLVRELMGLPLQTGRLQVPAAEATDRVFVSRPANRRTVEEHALRKLDTTSNQAVPEVTFPTTNPHHALDAGGPSSAPHTPAPPQGSGTAVIERRGGGSEPTGPQPASRKKGSNLPLLLGLAALIGLITLLGLVIAVLLDAGSDDPVATGTSENNLVVPGTQDGKAKAADTNSTRGTGVAATTGAGAEKKTANTPPREKQGEATKRGGRPWLYHEGGQLVFLTTDDEVPARIYYQGKLVGVAPLRTFLRAGAYEFEFRTDDVRHKAILSVTSSKPVNTLKVDMAATAKEK